MKGKKKRLMVLAGVLASFGAFAQMPVPLPDSADSASKAAATRAEAGKQLEALMRCKAGTVFTAKSMESLFQAVGLVKVKEEGGFITYFIAPPEGPQPPLFGGQILAASMVDVGEEWYATVLLKGQTGKQMAKKLGTTKRNELDDGDIDGDAPSYLRETSKKTTLIVGEASTFTFDNAADGIKYQSLVGCSLAK